MRKDKISITGIGDVFVTGLKLSDRFVWQEACQENKYLMMPSLMHLCIVDESGKRVKTQDEWDEWGVDNFSAATAAFSACLDAIGSTEAAEKK